MAGQAASQIEIPDSWVQQFKNNVAEDQTAGRAWQELEQASLQERALFLLWRYAGGADSELNKMHKQTRRAVGRIKAAIRAEEVARTTHPKRARNPNLFRQRASESRQDALKAGWPLPSGSVSTVGDELALASELKGREIPLDAAREAMQKAAGERSPVNRLYILFLLQSYAEAHGVTLGIKRLIALASCADLGRFLDEGTLGRYLREIPESVREGVLRDTLPMLPPPVPPKSKH